MSAGCVRWMLCRTFRAACSQSSAYRTPTLRLTLHNDRYTIPPLSWRCSQFSTTADNTEQTPEPKREKQGPKSSASVSSAGRLIPHREIQVISETGEDLGTMHRANALRMMDQKGLKLVLLSEDKDPPVYRLMSGKQIYEEQVKQREKQKAKPAPVQVKELAFSSGIASHDLTTKLKQVEALLEKKHQVRITLRAGRGQPAADLETALEQMVQQIEVIVGFVTKPQAIQDGRAAMCILRPPSAKELAKLKKKKTAPSKSDDDSLKANQNKTSAVKNTDTTEDSMQQ